MRSLLWNALVIAAVCGTPAAAVADDGDAPPRRPLDAAIVDYESGVFAFLVNDGRYGSNGTEFSTSDTNQDENLFVVSRLSLELVRGAHAVVLLYAPLDVTTRVALARDLQFRDELFAAGTVVDHRYLFDGYRVSYLYRLVSGQLSLQLGASLQVRNAKVAFATADGTRYEEESDIGLVPALKLRVTYRTPGGAYAMLDADGLSTFGLVGDTEGGLYDVGLTLGLPASRSVDVFVRARALGGGADVPDQEIENWGHFLSFTAGVRIALVAER